MNREDFLILKDGLIYLDSGATSLKPYYLSDSMSDYYNNYSANSHRGDYDISIKVDTNLENTRKLVRDFIGAKNENSIVFTNNTTDSINKIVYGYFYDHLDKDDEVLITKAEHASNILPWFELADKKGIKVKFIDLDENLMVTLDNVKKAITPNTKAISLAHVTNVVGDIRPIKEITKLAHKKGIKVLLDGAQSVPHMIVDVKDLDVDFLAFSAHKMCGPTGVGVLYVKEEHLKEISPVFTGGGMNYSFEFDGERKYNEMPYLLEAGTPNIAGIIGLGTAINYLNKIGMKKIEEYEKKLRYYAIERLKEVPNITIYNEKSEAGIITFNIKDLFSQDLAIYLNKYGICVRAGSHCAKILKDDLGIKNTVRISLYFYNTKKEIDELVEVLKNDDILNEII